jgi:hypothetical protein
VHTALVANAGLRGQPYGSSHPNGCIRTVSQRALTAASTGYRRHNGS